LLLLGLARDRTRHEPTFGVGEDGAPEASSLRSGGADDGDGLRAGHAVLPLNVAAHVRTFRFLDRA
jgi:hypothetical protein